MAAEPGPEPERDALAQVREHLDEAHAAADRLVREAHGRAEEAARAAAADVPPRGWDVPPGERGASGLPDLAPLLALIDAARRSVPPELTRQVAEALRELLLAIRAVIDWYIELLDKAPTAPAPVEDIPID